MNGALLDLESDDTQQSLNNRSGIAIETTTVIDGLECRISAQTEGAITAYLTDGGGEIVERQSIATVEPGETFEFVTELEADETYWILCDARGREYVRGRAAVEYPIEGDSFVATHGIFTAGGSQSDSYRYCIDRIGPASGGETLDLGADDEAQSWGGLDEWSGVQIQATVDIPEFQCRLSAETDGVTTAYLTDASGSVLDQQSIADLESGGVFGFDTGLSAGESYWIVCDADGESYVRGRAATDYPLESDSLVATNGIYGGGLETSSYRYCIDRIRLPDASESVGTVLDLGSDDEAQSWSGLDAPSGVRIQTNEVVAGLRCRLSEQTEGLMTAYLTTDAGDVLERQTIATLDAGDTFTFDTELDAQEAYRVVCDARGRAYVRGRAAIDYPVQSGSIEATHGIYSGDLQTSSYRYCLDQLGPAEESGTLGESPLNEIEDETDTLDLEGDDGPQSGYSGWSGIRLQTTEAVDGLECRLSAETDATAAYLTDDSGDILAQQSIDGVGAGSTFVFNLELPANETFWVVCDGDGDDYTRGRASVEYPIESEFLVATHGIHTSSGAQTQSFRYCIDRIRTTAASDDIDTLNLGADDGTQSGYSGWSGIRLQTPEAVHGIECRLSTETEATAAYLTDDSGNVLAQQSIADIGPGETFVFDLGLEAGRTYWVVCDGDGDAYTRGRASVNYPIESDLLVATHGIHTSDGAQTQSFRYCIDRIRTTETTETTETLDLGDDDDSQSGYTSWSGVRVQTTGAFQGLECRLSSETEATTAYLTDDAGNVVQQQSIDALGPGDTFGFDAEFDPDETYWIVCDGGGDSYTRGRAAVEYPIESDLLVATHGIHGGTSQTQSFRFCVDRIHARETRGGLIGELTNRPVGVTTVNVAADPSIDENGDLAAELFSYLADQDEVNHEFVLPMGTYSWNTEFQLYDPVDYLEIRGDPRATLQIRDHNVSVAFELGTWADDNPPEHIALRNLDVDIADEPERDAGLITAHVGRCLIDNVELVGQRWRHGPAGGGRYTCLINTRESDALSLIRNLSFPDGEIADSSEPSVGHSIGFSADPPHQGLNLWQQCYIEEYVDNGFYVSNSVGENLVVHGTAVNCGNGTLRIGADDEARDCKVLLDAASDQIYPGAGLWFNGGEPLAERIDVDGSDAQNDIVRINSSADGGYITGLDVYCGPNVDAPAIRCTYTSVTDPSGVLIEDFTVDDMTTANDNASVRIRRPDIAMSSGVVDAEFRPPLSGYYDPELDDVELS